MIKLHPQLIEALTREGKSNAPDILVPSARLGRQIREIWSEMKTVPDDPPIYTLDEWITQQGRELLRAQKLSFLPDDLAELTWRLAFDEMPDVVRRGVAPQFLADSDAMTRLVTRASQAWRDLYLYRIDLTQQNFADPESHMTHLFYHWAISYLEICRRKKLADLPATHALLVKAFIQEQLPAPEILRIGWNYPYPVHKYFLGVLDEKNPANKSIPSAFDFPAKKKFLTEYPNRQVELFEIAEAVVRAHREDPQKRISVVVPDLENNWTLVRRVFNRAFRQGQEAPSLEAEFDMSWGRKHNSYPIIGDMLALLALGRKPVPIQDLERVFCSPYISGYTKEQFARDSIDLRLKNLSAMYRRMSLADLLKTKQNNKKINTDTGEVFANCPELTKRLSAYISVEKAFEERATPAQWADIFMRQAQELGWGKEMQGFETSQEVQVWRKFQDVMDRLCAAGLVLEDCSRQEALNFLRKQTDAIFQPKLSQAKKVHILGMGPARGLGQDELFLSQMDEHAMPGVQPNFCIPFKLAHAARMPWCDIEVRRKQEEDVLSEILHASVTHISYAALHEDVENTAHPLLDDMQAEKFEKKEQELLPIILEEALDNMAPKIEQEDEFSAGIITTIQEQAKCPFRAFARGRLGAEAEPGWATEVTPIERGILLHRLLQNLWGEIQSHENLQKWDTEKIDASIEKEAEKVLQKRKHRCVFLEPKTIHQVEKRFLTNMAQSLFRWEKEKRKDGFKWSKQEEKKEINATHLPALEKISASSQGLDFKIRIDRVDSVIGGCLIIDYKTSKSVKMSHLSGERPIEPQLIIYSLVIPEKIQGIGFISFSIQKGVTLDGYSMIGGSVFPSEDPKKEEHEAAKEHGINLPKKAQVLSNQMLASMQTAVQNLLAEHIEGQAKANPHTKDLCASCNYSSLCRIHQRYETKGEQVHTTDIVSENA